MRLVPALRMLSQGSLTDDQHQQLLSSLQLDESPRTEGPGAAMSVAHRSFTTDSGNQLVLDLATTGESGWILALFYDKQGGPPSDETVENHRVLFRGLAEQFGLHILDVVPAATADEVFVVPPAPYGTPESAIGVSWDPPHETLEQLWPHLGLREDAPREVKKVKLREIMRTPAWAAAPEALRFQAENFLRDR
ncbi:hypothetical protein [Nocardiopsis ganjiahuensis]|uniref:hypothetical protein n=1 Tax=Nocardiopsis ganjiahuensis TaxID=239984 RepID=UPI000347DDF0|nr:hypothetical protein [Nocardiopsis ganjiahuensis]